MRAWQGCRVQRGTLVAQAKPNACRGSPSNGRRRAGMCTCWHFEIHGADGCPMHEVAQVQREKQQGSVITRHSLAGRGRPALAARAYASRRCHKTPLHLHRIPTLLAR